ncbi:MAG: glycoside hydrolase [Candidatus Binatia bacterium]|nr:MAG: glycoside hydrolase [Candidatus Binatia bacterium]
MTYRIAMVVAAPFPSPRGSQVLVRDLAEGLAERGHEVHVVCYAAGQPWTPPERVWVHRAPSFLGRPECYGPSLRRVAYTLLLLPTLFRVVRVFSIDVIHAHNYEAPILAYLVRRWTGIPVVYHGHNVMSDELARYFRTAPGRKCARLLARYLDRRVPAAADAVVALSEPMARFLRRCGVPEEKLVILPPAVAVPRRHARDFPKLREPEGPLVVYAGNLDPYQDIPALLRAMDAVARVRPETKLWIVTHAGSPSLGTDTLVAGRPNVEIRVAENFEGVWSALCAADVLVCPRTSWSGFPIKIWNYLATGLPVVTSRAVARLVGRKAGTRVFSFDGDSAGLARAILVALDSGGPAREEAVPLGQLRSEVLTGFEAVYDRVTSFRRGVHTPLQDCKNLLQKKALWGSYG